MTMGAISFLFPIFVQKILEHTQPPCTMGTGSLSRGLNGWGVALINHPHLAACYGETFTVTNYCKCKEEYVNKWSE
jgi:hypothetical protein